MLKRNDLETQPTIVKYAQPFRNGIQPHSFSRLGIGFVIRGQKNIYNGDVCQRVNQGEVFYLGTGNHYTEDIPTGNKPFEQIMFYYTHDQISSILSRLNQAYNVNIQNDHVCDNCRENPHVIFPAWNSLKNFFSSTNQYIKDNIFIDNPTAQLIKMTELIYLLLTQKDCCLRNKLLNNVDTAKEQFENIIHDHIFEDISIDMLSQKCNRSLTSFKKEFKKHFYIPPHKWFLKQRLMHSRLLLISTNKSVAEVGIDCNFPNTSHFIKLYRKEYGMTPSTYRNTYKYSSEIKNNIDFLENNKPATHYSELENSLQAPHF
ncbi:MAG: AraC family transcriptional regulator [Rikenellaceae bacterium]